MGRSYDDPRFGDARIIADGNVSASLAGTVGATILQAFPIGSSAFQMQYVSISFIGGGTGITRQLLIGTATPSGGTLGTIGYVGTITLGTQANNTGKSVYLGTGIPNTPGNTFPTVQALDAIIISQQGTDAQAYTIDPNVWGVETFTNL